jgi:hypothetical protein
MTTETETLKRESTRTGAPPPTRSQCGCLGWFFINAFMILLIGGSIYVLDRADKINWVDLKARYAARLAANQLIDPRELVPEQLKYHSVQLFNTDADEEIERVLFYHFDTAPNSPVFGAMVLDINSCVPRSIDSYQIFRIDTSELTQPTHRLETRDIPDVGDAGELLVWGVSKSKVDAELILFAWRDDSDPCRPASPGYINLGAFRGNGGIEIIDNMVRVKQRILERSNLAVTRVYAPVDGYYRQSIGGPMRPPVTSAVEFVVPPAEGQPDPQYPERAVLKFYLNIGVDTAAATQLLDPSLAATHIDGIYGRDVAEPGQLTSMADVWELHYEPDTEREARHERLSIEVKVINRRPDGSAGAPALYRVWLQGVPDEDALPYGCEWRIVAFEPVG